MATPTILTCRGSYFDFTCPEESEFDIYVIAHALSHLCRFTGHVLQFYSVAQHSVLVSQLVPPHLAMQGLLHDAAEAFIGDVAAPLKRLLPDYKAIERRVEAAVLARFGLPAELDVEVKAADLKALDVERRELMPPHEANDWGLHGIGAVYTALPALRSHDARQLFLDRFFALGGHA